MTEDQEEAWPSYDVGIKEHAHAVGVLSFNYNTLENELLQLLALYDGAPEDVVAFIFEKFSTDARLEWLRRLVKTRRAISPAIAKALLAFCDAYKVCTDNRNLIVHSRISALWTGTSALMLSKRSRGQGKESHQDVDLKTIRRVADEVFDWAKFAHHVLFYVKRRQRSRVQKYKRLGIQLYGPTTLPKISPPPIDLAKQFQNERSRFRRLP